ncbi:hypothetical protein C1H46_025150 [Malus baccata]|uniref:Uncharacterized protein n=1 Tax=Malus baccata TaxID=106549 RepID=A0A540LS26_MALBA|nr:hypothetical protein C1H46_025150 [Malus baccata]
MHKHFLPISAEVGIYFAISVLSQRGSSQSHFEDFIAPSLKFQYRRPIIGRLKCLSGKHFSSKVFSQKQVEILSSMYFANREAFQLFLCC